MSRASKSCIVCGKNMLKGFVLSDGPICDKCTEFKRCYHCGKVYTEVERKFNLENAS